MDTVAIKDRLTELVKKYKYAAIIVLVGIILMCLPGIGESKPANDLQESSQNTEVQSTISASLEQILAQIHGAGKVRVLLTESYGSEVIYQVDEDLDTGTDSSSVSRDVVLVTGADKSQSGLVRQVNPPGYLGAIVVCEGADNAQVRLAVVEAVRSVTGLGADHITVLKMK